MARYEFVDDKSSKFWEATLDGTALTVCFGRIGTAGQSQTKNFTTAELAKKEHDKLVAEKTKKGYKLVSGGGAPAAATPPATPAKKSTAPAAAALRKDFYVYNEATGFCVTSRRIGGKGWDSAEKDWEKGVRAGDLIPLELYQDDSFNIRVVVGGELEDQEDAEWVGRLDWKLRVPDGNLVVCAGSEYIMEEFEGEEDDYTKDFTRHMKIPRGDYRATIYMYMGGVNGTPCLRAARGGDEPDPLGEWFRRTRPGEKFPAWLHNDCVSDPAEDPGHEKEWKKAKAVEDPVENYIEFLLHLTPLKEGENVEMPKLGDGWFSVPTRCRVPEKIPLGIPAGELEGKPKKPDPNAVYPIDIFSTSQKFQRAKLSGSVEVPVDRLDRLFRVAWFCHVWSLPQIRVTLPKGSDFKAGTERIEKIAVRQNGEIIDIGFEHTGSQSGSIAQVGSASGVLKGLPDGSIIELDTLYQQLEQLKKEKPVGLHRYKGAVKSGKLAIEEYFPPVPAERMNAALALAAQVEKESEIDAGDEESVTALLAYLKKHPFFSDNPAVKKGATSIGMKSPEPVMLNFVAAEVFARKFKDVYPLFSFQDDDEEEEEEEIEEKKPAGPPIGDLILKGADGRTFHASDATKMPEAVATRIAEYEKELLPLGFKFVADIVVKPLQNILLRGYAQDGGSVWGAVMLYGNGGGMPEFVMSFPKHATLSVTRNITAADELYRNAFKKARQRLSLKEMFAEMEQRSAFLVQHFGKPAPVTATAKGLADDVEASFKRQKAEAPAPGHELLLRGDDGRRHYSADATLIDASAAKVFGDADKAMRDMGYKPVGDVVSTFMSAWVVRGYAKPGCDTWFKFQAEASSSPQCAGFWELATVFEKDACLVTTRRAMHKDEPKRKIFRILDDKPPEKLLKAHEERKAKLAEKYGKPLPISADLKGLAAEVEAAFVRLMG